jgi:hypothetical protein
MSKLRPYNIRMMVNMLNPTKSPDKKLHEFLLAIIHESDIVGPSVFDKISIDPRTLADIIWSGKSRADVMDILKTVDKGIKMRADTTEPGQVAAESYAGTDGHISIMSSHRMIFEGKAEDALLHMFKGFPQGCVLLPKEILQAILAEIKKSGGFPKDLDHKTLNKAAEDFLRSGGSIENCGAILGEECLINLGHILRYEDGDWTSYTIFAGTTEWHFLDGINGWRALVNKKTGEVIFSNILIGKYPVPYALDKFNNVLGKAIMHCTWETAVESAKAEKVGIPLEEHLDKTRPDLVKKRFFYQIMDSLASSFGIRARSKLGPNMTAETPNNVYTLKIEDPGVRKMDEILSIINDPNYANTLEKSPDGPGFWINGTRYNPTEYITYQLRVLDSVSPDKRDLARRLMDDKIKLCHLDMSDKTMEEVMKLYRDSTILAAEDRLKKMMDNTDIADVYRQKLRAQVLQKVQDAILDSYEENGILSNIAERDKRDFASELVDRLVIDPMFVPDGIFWHLALVELTKESEPEYTLGDIQKLKDSLEADRVVKEREYEKAKQEVAKLEANDPKRVQLQEDLEKQEKGLQENKDESQLADNAEKEAKEWDTKQKEKKENLEKAKEKFGTK